jgi:hypothetical protein
MRQRWVADNRSQRISVWLLLIGWMSLPGILQAKETYFTVSDASTRLSNGVYLLDASIDFRFSDAAMEALLNGIPLVLEVQIKVERSREWLWTKTIAALSQRYRLQYHALSERFVVHFLNTDLRQSFAGLDDALLALGEVHEFPMLDRRLLQDGDQYTAGLRATLVVEELPTPIRLWAYAAEQWRLDSPWYSWQLQP